MYPPLYRYRSTVGAGPSTVRTVARTCPAVPNARKYEALTQCVCHLSCIRADIRCLKYARAVMLRSATIAHSVAHRGARVRFWIAQTTLTVYSVEHIVPLWARWYRTVRA